MPAKKPKLPKVWVEFEEEEDGTEVPVSVRFYKTPAAIPYAPVQKPKVCVWVNVLRQWESCERTEAEKGTYCPRCGGKIKTR